MKTKKCKICHKRKLLDQFHKDLSHSDGRRSKCKICVAEYDKEHRKKNKKDISKQHKKYYQKNKKKICEYMKRYYWADSELRNKKAKEWRENNPDKVRAHRKRVKKREKARRVKQLQIRQNFVYDYLKKHPCVDCGETDVFVLEFDHVRGSKITHVKRLVGNCSSLIAIKAEIKKCAVRCVNCHIKKTAEDFNWYSRPFSKRRFVLEHLKDRVCVDCGENDIRVLQFDHVRGRKKGTISELVRGTVDIKMLKSEIAKCEVRCGNCHKRRHDKERKKISA